MKITVNLPRLNSVTETFDRYALRFKSLATSLYRRILLRTPVDTGKLRGNWQVSILKPNLSVIDRFNKSAELQDIGVISSIRTSVNSIPSIFFSNNLPYAETIEFGRYPNPVQFGTRLSAGQSKGQFTGPGWFQLSTGGFSRQAPKGMARTSIQEILGSYLK